MKENKKPLYIITLISVIIINGISVANGLRHHETWLVVIGAVSSGLICAAVVLILMKYRKEKQLIENKET